MISLFINDFLLYLFQSRCASDEVSLFFFILTCLYFTFIPKKYFHWIQNSGLTVLFFKLLKLCAYYLLASLVSDEKSITIQIVDSLHIICCFSLTAFWMGEGWWNLVFSTLIISRHELLWVYHVRALLSFVNLKFMYYAKFSDITF